MPAKRGREEFLRLVDNIASHRNPNEAKSVLAGEDPAKSEAVFDYLTSTVKGRLREQTTKHPPYLEQMTMGELMHCQPMKPSAATEFLISSAHSRQQKPEEQQRQHQQWINEERNSAMPELSDVEGPNFEEFLGVEKMLPGGGRGGGSSVGGTTPRDTLATARYSNATTAAGSTFFASPQGGNNTGGAGMVTPARQTGRGEGGSYTPTPLRTSTGLLSVSLQESSAVTLEKRKTDFLPIILVPSAASAIIQIWNAVDFLELGEYKEPFTYFTREDGATSLTDRPIEAVASPNTLLSSRERFRVKFNNFRVLDDPKQVTDWNHVCACIVTGSTWQFNGWYNGDNSKTDPSVLFTNVRGFLPFFEEDILPEQVKEWKVTPLQLTRKLAKRYTHLKLAATFWEELFKFLDAHPFFCHYVLPAS